MIRPFVGYSAEDLIPRLREEAWPDNPEVLVEVDGRKRHIDLVIEGNDDEGDRAIILKLR